MTRYNWMWILAVAFVCAVCGCDSEEDDNSRTGDVGGTGAPDSGDATAGTAGAAGIGGAAGASGSTAGALAIDDIPVLGEMTQARDDGQVVPSWDKLCVATFTRDYDISRWGEVIFSVRAGDRYLYEERPYLEDITLIFVGANGPVDFDIEPEADETTPFTLSCDPADAVSYVCVFVDTVVYQDADLTAAVCDLPAGACTRATSINAYAAQSSAPGIVYNVTFFGFINLCSPGEGYVAASEVKIGDKTYTTVPFARVAGLSGL